MKRFLKFWSFGSVQKQFDQSKQSFTGQNSSIHMNDLPLYFISKGSFPGLTKEILYVCSEFILLQNISELHDAKLKS